MNSSDMKKLLSLFAALILLVSTTVANAQTTQAKTLEPTHLKKDGTPDKRFKDNKANAPTAPTKQDGTSGAKYKANNAPTGSAEKKDGTPDMRYKANKKTAGKKTIQ